MVRRRGLLWRACAPRVTAVADAVARRRALTPPGYKPDWHIGVRQKTNGKLRALITGIPVNSHIYAQCVRARGVAAMHPPPRSLGRAGSSNVPMAEINFLCVHKKLRSKRLAPVLIKEVTRRVNLCGARAPPSLSARLWLTATRADIWQAVYTAGAVLPRPVARTRCADRGPARCWRAAADAPHRACPPTRRRLPRCWRTASPRVPSHRPPPASRAATGIAR